VILVRGQIEPYVIGKRYLVPMVGAIDFNYTLCEFQP